MKCTPPRSILSIVRRFSTFSSTQPLLFSYWAYYVCKIVELWKSLVSVICFALQPLLTLVTRRPYCPGKPKELCFTMLSLAMETMGMRLSVVKQSSFGLPGPYGRLVTRANSVKQGLFWSATLSFNLAGKYLVYTDGGRVIVLGGLPFNFYCLFRFHLHAW